MKKNKNVQINEWTLGRETSRYFKPLKGMWNKSPECDPITGLVSFPYFHENFPGYFGNLLRQGLPVGIAIGDVDHLKSFVEHENESDPLLFGHLAGNWFMNKLGSLSLKCFSDWDIPWGILSTFGGDEIIISVMGIGKDSFNSLIESLAKTLSRELPRTVSFGCGWFSADNGYPLADEPFFEHYANAMVMVDRTLFRFKRNHDRDWSPTPVWLLPQQLSNKGWLPIENQDSCSIKKITNTIKYGLEQ